MIHELIQRFFTDMTLLDWALLLSFIALLLAAAARR